MYSLLSGLYTYLTQKPTYKLLIFGIDNAGKTVYPNYPLISSDDP